MSHERDMRGTDDRPLSNDQEVGDDIHIAALRHDSYRAIVELASTKEWPDVRAWMEPAAMLLLIERLKRVPDHEDTFPAGKWATIQRLQDIFERGFWRSERSPWESKQDNVKKCQQL